MKVDWYKLKKHFLSRPIAYAAKYLLRLLLWTCRFEVVGLDEFAKIASQRPCILALWHNRLALMGEFVHRFAPQFIYVAFVSKSRDGEALAHFTTSYSIGRVIRVPHQARHQALKEAIDHLKSTREILIFTPDGPRGPACEVKPGVVKAAQVSGAPIIPFTWQAKRFWQLKTWDKFLLPKPFTTITVTLGKPTYYEAEAPIEHLQNALKKDLDQTGR